MMNINNKLSVIVLVYNTEEYLRDCLDSLVNQTLKDIEIIVVNDGSPDNSHLILEEYSNKYSNIRVINQVNSGGAIAGNRGIKEAKGEYIAIVDSDDIVPLDAYEKMYNKARLEKADIVMGKANILLDGVEREIVYKREREVWLKERVITNVRQFKDIFYDCFYWNKIFNREFIINNDCLMPPGMLYADRPMVHKAYLYAKKIIIIKDKVYIWRKRSGNSNLSITQQRNQVKNFEDRIESINYQIDYFNREENKDIKNDFLKRNIERLLFNLDEISENKNFRDIYISQTKKIFEQIDDIYDNDLGTIKNIYVYLIINELVEELMYYVAKTPTGPIICQNGRYYWKIDFFENKNINIPKEIFEIKNIVPQLVSILELHSDFKKINFSIEIPEYINLEKVSIELISRSNINQAFVYEMEINKEKPNIYTKSIQIDKITKTNDVYDIYLIIVQNGREYKMRFSKNMLKEESYHISNICDEVKLYFTNKNNLSVKIFDVLYETIKITQNNLQITLEQQTSNEDLKVYLKDRISGRCYYLENKNNRVYEIEHRRYIEKNKVYDLYYEYLGKSNRIEKNIIKHIFCNKRKVNKNYYKIYETNKGNISIDTSTFLKRLIKKLKVILKGEI